MSRVVLNWQGESWMMKWESWGLREILFSVFKVTTLSMFGSTYACEIGFYLMNLIKKENWNTLTHPHQNQLMRLSIHSIHPFHPSIHPSIHLSIHTYPSIHPYIIRWRYANELRTMASMRGVVRFCLARPHLGSGRNFSSWCPFGAYICNPVFFSFYLFLSSLKSTFPLGPSL